MNLVQQIINKKVNLNKFELIYASIYFLTGKILNTFAGSGVTFLIMCTLMIIFMILLIVFFKQHVYSQDKPLLTVLSIYYKTMAYVVIIFIIFNFSGKIMFQGSALFSIIFYILLSFIYGNKQSEALNAYLYLIFVVFFL